MHPIDHARRRCHQIQIIFPLQPFLDDLQMEQPQETAAEAKAKSYGGLRLKLQRRVVELQLFQRVS